MTRIPELDQDRDMGALAGLAGLEAVRYRAAPASEMPCTASFGAWCDTQ